jgi:hypothetical protein
MAPQSRSETVALHPVRPIIGPVRPHRPHSVDSVDVKNPTTSKLSTQGKVRDLSAVDMTDLTLSERVLMIYLSQPGVSDDAGRIAGPTFEDAPESTGLRKLQIEKATASLIRRELIIRYRDNGGLTYHEVKGAYNFKKATQRHVRDRVCRFFIKKKEFGKALRRLQAKRQFHGLSSLLMLDDDGTEPDVLKRKDCYITAEGHLVPLKAVWFVNTKLPAPDPKDPFNFLTPMNEDVHRITRLYPPFSVYGGLSPLGWCIRFYLETQADDFGRVKIVPDHIAKWLGKQILKQHARHEIDGEITSMAECGHLQLRDHSPGGKAYGYDFAFIRDSAQLLKDWPTYNDAIPVLNADREYHHSTAEYMAFINACRQAREDKKQVAVTSCVEDGTLVVGHVSAKALEDEFLAEYSRTASMECYHNRPLAFCGLDPDFWPPSSAYHPSALEAFWHAVKHALPLDNVKHLYVLRKNELDCTSGPPSADRKKEAILRRLLNGMLPAEYIADREARERPLSRVEQCIEGLNEVARRFDTPDDNDRGFYEESPDVQDDHDVFDDGSSAEDAEIPDA